MRAAGSVKPTIIGLIILMVFGAYYEAPHTIVSVRLFFCLSEMGFKYPIPGFYGCCF